MYDWEKQAMCPGGIEGRFSRFDLVRDAVADVRAVVPRPVELDDGAQRRGTPLAVGDVGPPDERRRARDDVVDLAHLVVFGNRVPRGLVELAAGKHTQRPAGPAPIAVPHPPLIHLLWRRV